LETLGKKIVILELTNIMAALTCLLMPVIFYHEYTKDNPLARLWVKYMPVSSDEYFSFMIPAVIALAIGLRLPLSKTKVDINPRVYMDNVKRILISKPSIGLTLIATGLVSGLLDFLSPASLKQIFYLMDHLTYVGVFYVIYSPSKHKKVIVPSVIIAFGYYIDDWPIAHYRNVWGAYFFNGCGNDSYPFRKKNIISTENRCSPCGSFFYNCYSVCKARL
jgi:hypothetical protein